MKTQAASELWRRLAADRDELRYAEAAALAAEFIDAWPEDDRRRAAEVTRLFCLSRLQRWVEVEARARGAAIDFPEDPHWAEYLAEAMFRQGRTEEADRMIEAAIAARPERTEPRALRAAFKAGQAGSSGRPARKIRVFPSKQAFEDARGVVETYLLRGMPALPLIRPDTVFMTLGSCFADNLAARLRASGHEVHAEGIGEEVNSTYANRYLLEWIEQGPVSAPTQVMDEFYGPATRERFRKAVQAADILVLTMGVAPAFFHPDTGEFVFIRPRSSTDKGFLYGQHVMRTTSVAENVDNVQAIIDAVRRISGRRTQVVLTVSPVPLGGTTEFHSAAVADCISKSTLRLACHEVLAARARDGVVYWPSFEIVRWFGPHFGPGLPRVYGNDDGHSRHVSAWLVDLIVDLFLEHYADRQSLPAA